MTAISASLARSVHPAPPDTRLHPLTAWRATQALLADPADTRQVFIVLRALRGRSGERMFHRFAAHPAGAAILRAKPDLLAHLNDSAALAALPEASLGQCYLRSMVAQGLTADALVAAQGATWQDEASADLVFFRQRMRDQHDLLHVLTGYGADPLGELCLLAFNHAQTGHAGMALMAVLGCLKVGAGARARRVWRAVAQAWWHGKRAAWLPAVVWETALTTPLISLRAACRIQTPTAYRSMVA